MHLSSTTTLLALSSLGASYVVQPFIQAANDNLMRRDAPYSVANVDADNGSGSGSDSIKSKSSNSQSIQTTTKTVTASSPPSPPVTVTVTSTPSSTPVVSLFPCSSTPLSRSSIPVSSSKVPPSSSIEAFSTVSVPKPSGISGTSSIAARDLSSAVPSGGSVAPSSYWILV